MHGIIYLQNILETPTVVRTLPFQVHNFGNNSVFIQLLSEISCLVEAACSANPPLNVPGVAVCFPMLIILDFFKLELYLNQTLSMLPVHCVYCVCIL